MENVFYVRCNVFVSHRIATTLGSFENEERGRGLWRHQLLLEPLIALRCLPCVYVLNFLFTYFFRISFFSHALIHLICSIALVFYYRLMAELKGLGKLYESPGILNQSLLINVACVNILIQFSTLGWCYDFPRNLLVNVFIYTSSKLRHMNFWTSK